MAADVFVSYSSTDKADVLGLIDRLRTRGISVWVDQGGIDGAAMWSEEIVEAIESCKVLMLMISSSSVSSHNVVKEVALSSERKKHILPVYLEQVELPKALKYPLAGIQHVEFFSDTEHNLETVIRSLTKLGVSIASAQTGGGAMPKTGGADAGPKLLAVLPFDNISPERDSDYFSDGLTEELIANLSKLSEIKVVSRTTTMQYKETKKDTKTIAAELNVHYILEGSVRKIADNLRITAQLVEVATDAHIWAETYKGTMADVFDIQERVAKEIADALKLKLTPTEKAVLTKRATIIPEAYDCWLRANAHLYTATTSGLQFAEQLFERAISLDTRYAQAYAGLAATLILRYQFYDRDEILIEKALDLGLKALMYESTLPDAYAALALAYSNKGDAASAIEACEKAIAFGPDIFFTYYIFARVRLSANDLDGAIAMIRESIRLNPSFYIGYNWLRMVYEMNGDPANSRKILDEVVLLMPKYLTEHPDDPRGYINYALNLAQVGREDEARRLALKALQLTPNDSMMQYYAACLYTAIGDYDLAVSAIAGAISAGWKDLDWIKRDPDLDPIRNHPGYIELMKDK